MESRILVTGSTKLAGAIIQSLNAHTCRLEDKIIKSDFDVFINNAHVGFKQTELLMEWFNAWKDDDSKLIINISSRAGLPNLSKGHLYAAQKASLDHLSDSLIYTTNKKVRITTLNLGMLEDELPSVSYAEVCAILQFIITLPRHLEIPRLFLQNSANYKSIQELKAKRYDNNITS